MDTNEKPDKAKNSIPERRRWRRAVVATSVLGGMLFSGAVILPTAMMKTSYRDSMLNSKLQERGLKVASQSGSGSWITPLSFQDVELSDEAGHVKLTVKSLTISQSLLGILTSGDLGKITIVQPDLTITLDDDGNLPLKAPEQPSKASNWDLEFDVQNAAFKLVAPWRKMPIVAVSDIDIEGDITTTEDGRWLTIQPVQIFDHERLSEAHSEQNLALIAPVLAQSTALEGEVSAHLEGSRIRLDADKVSPFPIRGSAVFHSVNTRLRDEWAVQINQMLGNRLAPGAAVPNRLEIARDSVVNFEVDERGIHHHGLGFLLPNISTGMNVESSGMVGLDETLDLALSLQLPQMFARNPFAAALSTMLGGTFQLQVKGTIAEPKLITPPGFSMIDQLSANADPLNFSPEPKPVGGSVMDLIGGVASPNSAQSAQGLPGNILEMIRSIQKAKEDAPPKQKRIRKRDRRFPQAPLPE